MSKQRDSIFIKKLLEASENPSLCDPNVYDEKALIEAMHEAIAYGRATPDREMLKRFASLIAPLMSRFPSGSEHLDNCINQFLEKEIEK